MNPYYYLFYKLTSLFNKKGNHEIGPIYAITISVFLYFLLVFLKILQLTKENFNSTYKYYIGGAVLALFIINYLVFRQKKLVDRIKNKYENERPKSKIIGNIFVIIFMILPYILLIIITPGNG
ncbi:MAG: hypothetical protein CL596_05825 [Alteromonas sp.]|nr:hypothetical protein [Alteromonas sp.]MAY23900.1 hypothetical protein [Flavobacteriaceae bacterium]|tara:strand:+ start:17310 stop:17678 length:369 start_codon:yes stop_codon:yes gene_type:complete